MMRLFIAILVYLTGLHYNLIEMQWLGCDTTIQCEGDVCIARFYCP